jgi:hypothetical protein
MSGLQCGIAGDGFSYGGAVYERLRGGEPKAAEYRTTYRFQRDVGGENEWRRLSMRGRIRRDFWMN